MSVFWQKRPDAADYVSSPYFFCIPSADNFWWPFLKEFSKVYEFFLSFYNITSVLVFNSHIRLFSIISFSSAALTSSSLHKIFQSDYLLSFRLETPLFFICCASLAFLATESLPFTFSQTGLFLLISVLSSWRGQTLTVLHDSIIFVLYLKKNKGSVLVCKSVWLDSACPMVMSNTRETLQASIHVS